MAGALARRISGTLGLRGADAYVLLHGAAYGRYLALSPVVARPVQRGYDEADLENVIAVPCLWFFQMQIQSR
ncbi:hypothetical protein PR202_gb13373 [Eleusine coracana subsp. coracana]|uniref:Uncharacterized protein n=1 Tax=Eleusine coracana subsp. coracana TaxID=191504 RepID=A0AAV5ERW1_ELECO|nr:hypothetical protein PR202_gb13373 [Eleusine coracana subsp. coracana]